MDKIKFFEKKLNLENFKLVEKILFIMLQKKFLSGKFVYRKFTLVEGMYKYELINF